MVLSRTGVPARDATIAAGLSWRCPKTCLKTWRSSWRGCSRTEESGATMRTWTSGQGKLPGWMSTANMSLKTMKAVRSESAAMSRSVISEHLLVTFDLYLLQLNILVTNKPGTNKNYD